MVNMANRGSSRLERYHVIYRDLRGLKSRRLDQNQVIPPLKVSQNNEPSLFNFPANFHGITPTNVDTTYAWKFLKNFFKIGLPGNQIKIFISWDSASLTESETLFWYQKISTGENLVPRNSVYISRFSMKIFHQLLTSDSELLWDFSLFKH